MNDDTTVTLDEKLKQCQIAFDISLNRAHDDANARGLHLDSQSLRWMHEDHAKEIERILYDDREDYPDTWQQAGVWAFDEPNVRAAINGRRVSGYHYTERYAIDVDTGADLIVLFRKAVSND